jgi:hypothetical protein
MDRFEGLIRGGLTGAPLHWYTSSFSFFDPGECCREPLWGLYVGHAVDVAFGGGIAVDVQLLFS